MDLFDADAHRLPLATGRLTHTPAQIDSLKAGAALAAICFDARKDALLERRPFCDHVAERRAHENAKESTSKIHGCRQRTPSRAVIVEPLALPGKIVRRT